MGSGSAGANLQRQLHTLTYLGVVGHLTDGQLLERVVTGRDETARAAFSALVERHGPMVLRVCRAVLGDTHDTQDAFQATFLVLARRAGSVRKANSVASWLHGVARRVSLRARTDDARRKVHEQRWATLQTTANRDAADPDGSWPELHEEIARLPRRYREPVVLCYLEGLTTEAAAQWIGCPQGTVLSRLSRARERLRCRMTRRGVALPAGLAVAGMSAEGARAAMPAGLLDLTVRASLGFAEQKAATAVVASATAAALARGVIHAMTIAKLSTLGAATLACVVALGGIHTYGQFGGIGTPGHPGLPTQSKPDDDRQAALTSAVERLQTDLNESNRRNTELQKQLQDIRAELKGLSAGTRTDPAAPKSLGKAQKSTGTTAGAGAGPGGGDSGAGGGIVIPKGSPGTGFGQPGGMGGGMAGMIGTGGGFGRMQPDARRGERSYMRIGNVIMVNPPPGDRLQFYNLETNESTTVRLPATKEAPLKAMPVLGPGVAALMISGPKVTRIAASLRLEGPWYVQELREPVEKAMPMVGPNSVIYALGRYIYAFAPVIRGNLVSSSEGRWGVLELPEGTSAQPITRNGIVEVETDGHIYTFTAQTGKWNHIDIEALLKKAQEKNDEAPATKEKNDEAPATKK